MGKTALTNDERARIKALRHESTAAELAQIYGVSERTVQRIWADPARLTRYPCMDLSSHCMTPSNVNRELLTLFTEILEARTYYRAKQDAHPDNCAWGNLEVKLLGMSLQLLQTAGNWHGFNKNSGPDDDSTWRMSQLLAGMGGGSDTGTTLTPPPDIPPGAVIGSDELEDVMAVFTEHNIPRAAIMDGEAMAAWMRENRAVILQPPKDTYYVIDAEAVDILNTFYYEDLT